MQWRGRDFQLCPSPRAAGVKAWSLLSRASDCRRTSRMGIKTETRSGLASVDSASVTREDLYSAPPPSCTTTQVATNTTTASIRAKKRARRNSVCFLAKFIASAFQATPCHKTPDASHNTQPRPTRRRPARTRTGVEWLHSTHPSWLFVVSQPVCLSNCHRACMQSIPIYNAMPRARRASTTANGKRSKAKRQKAHDEGRRTNNERRRTNDEQRTNERHRIR